jgi:hypothetical protein
MRKNKRSKQQINNFKPWVVGGRGRPPFGCEYMILKRKKDKRLYAIKKDISDICISITTLAMLTGIHKIRMGNIISNGLLKDEECDKIPGISELLKAIKEINK